MTVTVGCFAASTGADDGAEATLPTTRVYGTWLRWVSLQFQLKAMTDDSRQGFRRGTERMPLREPRASPTGPTVELDANFSGHIVL